MSLLTKKQFGAITGVQTKALSVFISRGKVIVEKNLIDTENSINIAFMNKHKVIIGENFEQIPREETWIDPATKVTNPPGLFDESIPQYHISEQKLKYLDTLKREKEISLLKIKEEKINGTVIPSELIKPVFLQHNQSVITEFKNMTEETLRSIAKTYSIPLNKVAELKGEWMKGINRAILKATELSVKAVDVIINDFSEKRGVGQRG